MGRDTTTHDGRPERSGGSDAWFYERTTDGWEIRDENRLLVAVVPDPRHEREADARRIAASASR